MDDVLREKVRSFWEQNASHHPVNLPAHGRSGLRCLHTTWKPFRLVPSPTTHSSECRTVTCLLSYWCLHLTPDFPLNQVNPNPSAVALRVEVVDTLFSCQPIDCEHPRIAKSYSVPLVLLPGLSNDAKPPMSTSSRC